MLFETHDVPETYDEAIKSEYASLWKTAMYEERHSLEKKYNLKER